MFDTALGAALGELVDKAFSEAAAAAALARTINSGNFVGFAGE